MDYTVKSTIVINGQKVEIEGMSPQAVSSVLKDVLGSNSSTVRSDTAPQPTKRRAGRPKGSRTRGGIKSKATNSFVRPYRELSRTPWSAHDLSGIVGLVVNNPHHRASDLAPMVVEWLQEHGDKKDRNANSADTLIRRIRKFIVTGKRGYLSADQLEAIKRHGYAVPNEKRASYAQSPKPTDRSPVNVISTPERDGSSFNYLGEA